jgi:hypothetical protein
VFARLAPATEDDLIYAGGLWLRLAGDEPNTVLEADLVRVLGVEVAASLYSSGGWWRRLR